MTGPGLGRSIAGRYRIVNELARGQSGATWLANDEVVGRQVALEELWAPAGLTAPQRELFTQRAVTEARDAARVQHSNAVVLHEVVPATADDEAMYLVTELVQAPTLAEVIAHGAALPAARIAVIALQLLDVLDAAHTLGVVHRDVKPANIKLAPGDQVKLAGFGTGHHAADARLTAAGGDLSGTQAQAHLAPELLSSGPPTPAADLWSLGATLYYAAHGHGPFDRDSAEATRRAILLEELPTPTCDPTLASAIRALLVRDPARRATSRQVRAMLEAAVSTATTTLRATPASQGTAASATTAHAPAPKPGPATWNTAAGGPPSQYAPTGYAYAQPPRQRTAQSAADMLRGWLLLAAAALCIGGSFATLETNRAEAVRITTTAWSYSSTYQPTSCSGSISGSGVASAVTCTPTGPAQTATVVQFFGVALVLVGAGAVLVAILLLVGRERWPAVMRALTSAAAGLVCGATLAVAMLPVSDARFEAATSVGPGFWLLLAGLVIALVVLVLATADKGRPRRATWQ